MVDSATLKVEETAMKWIIAYRYDSLFYNMDLGWTSLDEATLWDEYDKLHTTPPRGGYWILVDSIPRPATKK